MLLMKSHFYFYVVVLMLHFLLKRLNVGVNKITAIPTQIGLLTDLNTLWWGEFLCFINIMVFFWNYNCFSDFALGQYPHIILFLDLFLVDVNEITTIPTHVGLLTKLETLKLSEFSIANRKSNVLLNYVKENGAHSIVKLYIRQEYNHLYSNRDWTLDTVARNKLM